MNELSSFSSFNPKRILIVISPAFIFYLFSLVISSQMGIESSLVLRDLRQICEYPFFVGSLSSCGILLWAAASAINLFVYLSGLVDKLYSKIIMLGFIFSIILCLDDFFLLHDSYQIFQDILYPLYSVLALSLFFSIKNKLSSIQVSYLFTSCFLLASSIVLDIFQDFLPFSYDNVQIFEEGAKFIGIFLWLIFWMDFAKFSLIKSK